MEERRKPKKEKGQRKENMGEMGRKEDERKTEKKERKQRRREGSKETLSPFIELFQFHYSQRDKEVEYIKHID